MGKKNWNIPYKVINMEKKRIIKTIERARKMNHEMSSIKKILKVMLELVDFVAEQDDRILILEAEIHKLKQNEKD